MSLELRLHELHADVEAGVLVDEPWWSLGVPSSVGNVGNEVLAGGG